MSVVTPRKTGLSVQHRLSLALGRVGALRRRAPDKSVEANWLVDVEEQLQDCVESLERFATGLREAKEDLELQGPQVFTFGCLHESYKRLVGERRKVPRYRDGGL